ncbi:MAG: hypothetical protein OES26_24445, partial [Gammaproteobacteria bacterium]|nr:hypothetical protein [Gammaproteobacteria bacterium]
MAKPIPEQKLHAIEAVVAAHPDGIGIQDIEDELEQHIARRTLQYRLKHLVDKGRLVKEGQKRWAKYRPPGAARDVAAKAPEIFDEELAAEVPISKPAAEIQRYVRKPVQSRKPVGYD